MFSLFSASWCRLFLQSSFIQHQITQAVPGTQIQSGYIKRHRSSWAPATAGSHDDLYILQLRFSQHWMSLSVQTQFLHLQLSHPSWTPRDLSPKTSTVTSTRNTHDKLSTLIKQWVTFYKKFIHYLLFSWRDFKHRYHACQSFTAGVPHPFTNGQQNVPSGTRKCYYCIWV